MSTQKVTEGIAAAQRLIQVADKVIPAMPVYGR
jgi:hypothetical protein